MLVLALHHVSLIVADSERAVAFYRDLLGLPLIPRPKLDFPGVWLALGPQQLHLLELPNPDPTTDRPAHGGRDRHIALLVSDLNALEQRLQHAAIPFTRSRSGRAALFCRDPDGNGVELIQLKNDG